MSRSGPISLRLVSTFWAAILLCSHSFAAEPPWLEIHSSHFTVITDAGEKRGREVALRFEQMRAVFASLLSKDRLNQPVPLTVLALKNDKMFYQCAPLRQGQPIDVPGFFLPGEDQDFIVLNLFEEESWRAVAHDFAHMLLNYNYPPAQGWFDEGLAEYFSSIRLDNKEVEIGGDPELRPSVTSDLLQNQVDAHPPKSLTELLGANVWLSIPDLFSMKHDVAGSSEGTHHTLYYAESWMVMHYLLHENKLSDTGTYFGLVLNQRLPVEEAIQKAYGMSATEFEKAVKDYFHSQSALITAVDAARQKNSGADNQAQAYHFASPVGPDDSAITSTPLPESDAKALYAEVQVRVPERRGLGLKTLQALITQPTPSDAKAQAKAEKAEKQSDDDSTGQLPSNAIGNELAHRVLAWDQIEHGEFEAAMTELGDAAALNRNDMWLRYYLSVLKYRMAQAKHNDMQGLANMMLDLRAVLEWYPEMANAYDLLALARNEGGTPATAMQAERAAMNLSPRDESYVFHMAQIYIASKKWEAADDLLDRLRGSSNPQMVTLARDTQNQIATQRKYGLAGATAEQPKLAPQKTPFDVLNEDAAKRAAEEKTAQQSGSTADQRPTKFLKGRLVAVDCSKAPAAIVTIATERAVLKLRAGDYKSVLTIGGDDFSCTWQDRQVTVNYKPGGMADGDLVSIEVR